MRATSAPSAKESSAPAAQTGIPAPDSKTNVPVDESSSAPAQASAQPNAASPPPADRVVIADAGQLRVPSFIGMSVRQGIEEAGTAGHEAAIVGNGKAHEQAPAPAPWFHPEP